MSSTFVSTSYFIFISVSFSPYPGYVIRITPPAEQPLYIAGRGKNSILYLNGYRYHKQNITKKGVRTTWVCQRKYAGCRAVLHMNSGVLEKNTPPEGREHDHPPEFNLYHWEQILCTDTMYEST